MPRSKKKKEESLEPKELDAIEPEVKPQPKSKGVLKVLAWFRGKDEEGDMTKLKYESEGEDLTEAINKLEFPENLNVLVNLEVKRGDKEVSVALAPHDARAILQHKKVGGLGRSFWEV